jgi:uncharacterized protein (TIRG00374 family)
LSDARAGSTWKKWAMRLVKLAVCAGALWYLSGKVFWLDRVRLAEDPQHVLALISERDGAMTLRDPDTRAERDAARSALARPEQLAPGQRDVELGLRSVLRQTDAGWSLLALLILGPVVFLLSWRLRLLLDTQDITLTYRDALLLTFAGNFFNFALPGTTGGDVYKAYHIARRTHKRTEGVTVVLLDRVIGLISFLLLAGVTIFFSWRHPMIGVYGRWVGYMMLAFLLCAAMFFSRRFRRFIGYDGLIARLPFADKIRRVDDTTLSLRYHRQDTLLSLAITLFSHFLLVISVFCLARGLGIHPTDERTAVSLFAACLLATVVGYLLAAVPISVQGFGLLEAVFAKVIVEGHWGTYSQMLALTLGMRLLQIIWALPGVIVPWLGFARPTSNAAPAGDG